MSAARRNRPYANLARFYDALIPGVPEMNRQARETILGARLREIESACDLACGNGSTAIDLAQRGLVVHAVDNSPQFLRIARARAREAGVRVRFHRADMRAFKLPEPVDLLLCEFAALNNLDRRTDLSRVMRCVARAVRPGGTFLFDVNTLHSFATQIPRGEWVDRPEFKLVMRGEARKDHLGADIHLEWFLPARGAFRHERETIRHVAWTEGELRSALRAAGFGKVRTFDGADVRPASMGTPRGTDLYVLAKRR